MVKNIVVWARKSSQDTLRTKQDTLRCSVKKNKHILLAIETEFKRGERIVKKVWLGLVFAHSNLHFVHVFFFEKDLTNSDQAFKQINTFCKHFSSSWSSNRGLIQKYAIWQSANSR